MSSLSLSPSLSPSPSLPSLPLCVSLPDRQTRKQPPPRPTAVSHSQLAGREKERRSEGFLLSLSPVCHHVPREDQRRIDPALSPSFFLFPSNPFRRLKPEDKQVFSLRPLIRGGHRREMRKSSKNRKSQTIFAKYVLQ